MADLEGCMKALSELCELWHKELTGNALEKEIKKIDKRVKKRSCFAGFLQGVISVYDITGKASQKLTKNVEEIINDYRKEYDEAIAGFWKNLKKKEEVIIRKHGFQSIDEFIGILKGENNNA